MERNIPIYVDRSLQRVLSENGYKRSDKNKNIMWKEIKKLIPNATDDEINEMALRDATEFENNYYSNAWSEAFDNCESDLETDDDCTDSLDGKYFDNEVFIDKSSVWPPSK